MKIYLKCFLVWLGFSLLFSFAYLALVAFIYNENLFWCVSTINVGKWDGVLTRWWMGNRLVLVLLWVLSVGFAASVYYDLRSSEKRDRR
jgi:hypothetical protein